MRVGPSSILEVVTSWGDAVLSVDHLRAGERLVLDRSMLDDGSTPLSTDASRPWSLAGVTARGQCWVELPPSALFAIESTDAAVDRSAHASYERASRDGEAFELAEGVRVRCACGARTVTIRVVRDERPAPGRTPDGAWLLSLLASVAMVFAVLTHAAAQSRPFESALLEPPREAETSVLRALIERAAAQASDDRSFRKRSNKGALERLPRLAFFCGCDVHVRRLDELGLPVSSGESPFTRGLHGLLSSQWASDSGDEEVAFGGLGDAFGAASTAGWTTRSSMGMFEWGPGVTSAIDSSERQRRIGCRAGERWRGARRGCEAVTARRARTAGRAGSGWVHDESRGR